MTAMCSHYNRFKTYLLALVFGVSSLALSTQAYAQAPDAAQIEKGTAVFDANCKQCHAIDEVVVGPALRDATKRWPSEAAILNFIKYPQKTIEGGNAYAKGLYDKYKQFMPNHDFLKDDEIKAVIAYIKNPPAKVEEKKTDAAGAEGAAKEAAPADNGVITYVLAALVLVLFLVLVVLGLLVSVLTKYLNSNTEGLDEDDKEVISQTLGFDKFFGSVAFKAAVGFVFFIMIAKAGYDKVYSVGIHQGYAPRQPIAFSHKLHAGMYEINCNYCHTGVYKAKSASIPSVNICLNCHNSIKTESPEIKKLYSAVEKNRPIEWVRVHNLPDLAYFNHSQHTKVGGVECQTCHGNIQDMEVVQQHSSLTMGWCINCHRETVVKAEGNAYYDKLVAMHAKKSKEPMKVENIGGLECSKCHY
ncbi:cytochrome c3 family protein [Flexibacter flexilis]|nr:cytochrome c3 family protein [Flexibacter flexilis]